VLATPYADSYPGADCENSPSSSPAQIKSQKFKLSFTRPKFRNALARRSTEAQDRDPETADWHDQDRGCNVS